MYTDYEFLYYNSLYHSGVKGMKWGVRKRAAEYAKSIGQQLGYGGVAAISGHKQNNDTVNLASEYFRKHKNSTIGLHEAAKNEEESRNKALREKYSSYSY